MQTVALSLVAATALSAAAARSLPPIPADLKPWVDYAKSLQRDPACPPGRECVQLSQVDVAGNAPAGEITMTVRGVNVGRRPAEVFLLAPATTFSVQRAHFSQGSGAVRLDEGRWRASIAPGAFVVELQVTFEAAPSIPMELPANVAHVSSSLRAGSLVFDETSPQHGGSLYLRAQNPTPSTAEAVSLQITRAVRYSGVVTFTYAFAVSGLREQTRLPLPLLGDETIEALDPPLPYTASSGSVEVTLSPDAPVVKVTGHFNQPPTELQKPANQPSESWLISSDPRHPVELGSDGIEIDASEIKALQADVNGRAFLLRGGQKLSITPVPVQIDAGLQGAGKVDLQYRQGTMAQWLGELHLNLTSAPATDRLLIPTPTAAHYAEVAQTPVRLFGQPGALSLRLDGVQPIRVQWREVTATNPLLGWFHLDLPGQNVHLDEVNANVDLLPGYVPVAVFGTDHTQGDLLEAVQLYAILLAMLGMALARAARFPTWATVILGVLLAGLYTVEGFPREVLLVLLTGCAVVMRLPTTLLQRLRLRTRLHRLIAWSWVLVCLGALSPSVMYARQRLVAALYPWSAAESPGVNFESSLAGNIRQDMAMKAAMPRDARRPVAGHRGTNSYQDAPGGAAEAPDEAPMPATAAAPVLSPPPPSPPPAPAEVTEKTVRPVSFAGASLPATRLAYTFGSRLPGQASEATVLFVGPLIRGLWMLSEVIGLAVVLVLLFLRSRRLWWPEEAV